MAEPSEYDIDDEYTEERRFTGTVTRRSDDEIARGSVRGKHDLFADEPEWIEEPGAGNDEHPAPVDYLLFGLVACQVEVLDQALQKARIEDYEIEGWAEVDGVGADEAAEEMLAHHGSRVEHITVEISLTVPPEFESRAQRCLEVYDTGCIVGQSYRHGIDYSPRTSLQVET